MRTIQDFFYVGLYLALTIFQIGRGTDFALAYYVIGLFGHLGTRHWRFQSHLFRTRKFLGGHVDFGFFTFSET